ncbi:MAG: tetratricopeptide repeat protein, partial [Proteobacteria bacterium]|nr:tetratricopeptide repeat protein [Pseudomonadota bacterium]
INLFTRFIAAHPGNSKAYCGRGNALLAKDENEKAMTDFCKSIELNPHYATAYFSRGELFSRIGNKKEAEEDIMTANQIQQQISKAYMESQGYIDR